MSNHLSIAVVTAAIHEIVQAAVQSVVAGAIVRVGPPRAVPPGEKEVNVYLYHLTPNSELRNRDLPMRSADGTLITRPQAAIRLHYLISFSGEDQLATEIMLGKVIAVLHEAPILTERELNRVVRPDGSYPFLQDSDLPAQPEHIKLTPEYLSFEELTKLWTVFFQIAHRPSLQYVATPVFLDGELLPEQAGTVRTVDIGMSTEAFPEKVETVRTVDTDVSGED